MYVCMNEWMNGWIYGWCDYISVCLLYGGMVAGFINLFGHACSEIFHTEKKMKKKN